MEITAAQRRLRNLRNSVIEIYMRQYNLGRVQALKRIVDDCTDDLADLGKIIDRNRSGQRPTED